jgi:hypothetical protein
MKLINKNKAKMALIFNYNYKHLIMYIINVITLFFMFIFFGNKKNKYEDNQKIYPLTNADEELGYTEDYDYFKNDENIKEKKNKINFKIKIE